MKKRRSRIGMALCLAAVILGVGCADVKVRKVDPANPNAACGHRYYLPRPYVVVKKDFPIAGDEFLVSGLITSDRQDVIQIEGISRLPTEVQRQLRGLVNPGSKGKREIAVSSVTLPRGRPVDAVAPARDGEVPRAGRVSPGDDGQDGAETVIEVPEDASDSTGAKTKVTATMAGNPDSKELINIDNYFSVIYLPDFDEQYAVEVKAGLGHASMDMALKHGWLLEKSNINIDNRELGKWIFSKVDKLMDAFLPLPMKGSEAPEVATETIERGITEAAGGPLRVTLRLRYQVDAQRGMYPVLKPSEQCRNTTCGLGTDEWLFLPYPPYTVIPFQVRRRVEVELVSLTSAPNSGG